MFTALRAVRAPEESARAFVYRILSTYIREMFLRPGEKLVETDVAQELRVSRTPVHDTFARLVREKMLRPAPRGAVVPPLNADAIGQYIWMYRTTCIAVLGELYNNRPASLQTLERCVEAEHEALQAGALVRMAGLQRAFFAELFRLAGRLPVLAAMEQSSPDLYRLMRLLEDARMWAYLTGCHAAMVQSLTRHDHEGAVAALEAEFDLFKPLLEECLYLQPHYFEQDAAALSEPRESRSSESIDEP